MRILPCLVCLSLVVPTAVGCAPQTAYRRSALVASPRGDTLTTPLRGDVQLGGTASHTDSGTDPAPEVGDPALHVAQTRLRGHARFRAGDYVTLGGEVSWSHLSLSDPSAHGTPPVTGENIVGLGPTVSVHLAPKGSRASFAFAAALTVQSVPYTIWERTTPAGVTDSSFDPAVHRVASEGSDLLVLTRVSGAVNYTLHEHFQLHSGLSFQNHVVNIGFDDQEREGSTLSASDLGVVPYLGAKATTEHGLYAVAQWYFPLGYEQLNGPRMGGSITLGAELD